MSQFGTRKTKMEKEKLHERLKKMRVAKGLTAKEMAKLIDVAESTYRDWENGKGIKLPPFQSISQVLAVSVTELVTGEIPSATKVMEDLNEVEKKIVELKAYVGSRL